MAAAVAVMRRLCRVVLLLCAALDGVRLTHSVEDLLRELRTHVGSVHAIMASSLSIRYDTMVYINVRPKADE